MYKNKNLTLGLIMVLLFPMFYLPISINNQRLSSDNDSMPYTYEEWRIFLLELNDMTLEDLDSLESESIYYLNKQARIYAGWSNGTYSDEERDRIFADLHSSPIISDPTFNRNDDEKFKATTMITVVPLAFEHCFRVYAYLDYNRGDTNTGGGNRFHDLTSTKPPADEFGYPGSWPGYLTWDDYPYESLPFISNLDPYEGFLGSHYVKAIHHGQQILPVDWYTFEMDNPLEGTAYSAPKDVYFVIQMLYRYDTMTTLTNYHCHFKWVTKIYSVTINDDDTTGPILPVQELPFIGTINPIKSPDFIYDSDESFEIDVLAYDLESGLGNRITFDGQNVLDGEFLDDVLIEWGGIFGDDIYAYWYRYTVINNFGYAPGYVTVDLDVWNDDNDGWTGDPDSTTEQVSFLVFDDDTLAPVINVIYTGDGTDENPGELIVSASDESGLSIDPTGTYPVPNSLGTHLFYFTATDNDNDRPNDALTKTVEISIEIVDDDTTKPYFENIIINDDHIWLNINFNGIDIPEGDDLGLSIIEIYIDDVLIHTYFPSPTEDTFNFSFINEWIFDKGVHDIRVIIVDADNDRPDDALSNNFSETFEVTLDEMYEYVIWQLEELKNYVDENLEGFLPWGIRFLLWLAQESLEDAYYYFQIDKGVWGLARDKLAQALTHISGFIVEMFNYWEMISDEDAEFIISALHTIRNDIVFLMGESVGVEQSISIAFIEIDLLNLNDFIHENLNWTSRFFLESLIYGAVFWLEGALFKIVLDLSTECMLTRAQIALDNALTEVDDLLNSGKISQEIADILKSKIVQAQVDIEMVKNSS
ncbi:MAG: hypothetical protein ACFFG0_38000 [Candidatus Thorarchaeota archaeon]